jgi:hypothetical protein
MSTAEWLKLLNFLSSTPKGWAVDAVSIVVVYVMIRVIRAL